MLEERLHKAVKVSKNKQRMFSRYLKRQCQRRWKMFGCRVDMNQVICILSTFVSQTLFMKKLISAAVIGAAIFAGCKERNLPIDFKHLTGTGTDTTYVMTSGIPSTPDPHNVLIEEFSGQSCTYCPAAVPILEGFERSGNVNVVTLYVDVPGFTQTEPNHIALYDFRNSIATSISDAIYGSVNALPQGGVDRTPLDGQILFDRNHWSRPVGIQKAIVDPLNLKIESSFSGGTASIIATVTYLQPVTDKQNLSVMIVEDSMVDIQETTISAANPQGWDTTYVFTNVFRETLTSAPFGDPFLDTMATKERGRVFVRKFTYTPKVLTPAIKPSHCRIVAFVNAPGGISGDYRIIQSVQTKLIP